MKQFTVWVGGSEIGTYNTMNEAREVADDWILDGYNDTLIEAEEVENETPAQTNAWLLSGGY